jgi:hypothetical protein
MIPAQMHARHAEAFATPAADAKAGRRRWRRVLPGRPPYRGYFAPRPNTDFHKQKTNGYIVSDVDPPELPASSVARVADQIVLSVRDDEKTGDFNTCQFDSATLRSPDTALMAAEKTT